MYNSKQIRFWAGPLIVLISILITPPEVMRPKAVRALGVMLLIAIWWITECIPIYFTAFVPIALFPILGILDASTTSENYGNNYVLMLLGGFFLAKSIEISGFRKIIAIVRNAFGKIIKEHVAPEDGIVIGENSNPANMSGGRIIHLGIIEEYLKNKL